MLSFWDKQSPYLGVAKFILGMIDINWSKKFLRSLLAIYELSLWDGTCIQNFVSVKESRDYSCLTLETMILRRPIGMKLIFINIQRKIYQHSDYLLLSTLYRNIQSDSLMWTRNVYGEDQNLYTTLKCCTKEHECCISTPFH